MKKLFLSKLLAFVFFALVAMGTDAQCLSGWSYMTPIRVSNGNAAPLFTYQVKVTVNTASLVSAGKMQSSGADIRFTDSATCTPLYYWIESGMNSSSTVIWVKTLKIPAGGTQTINMFYGNSSAVAVTNGDSTFDFFDDFSGNVLNTSKWNKIGAGTSSWTVSGGTLSLKTRTTADVIIRSLPSFSSAITEEANVTVAASSSPSIAILNNGGFAGYTLNLTSNKMVLSEAIGNCASYKAGTSVGTSTSPGTITGIWGIQWPESNQQAAFWPGGSITGTDTNRTIASSVNIAAGGLCGGATNESMSIDWIRVRKYAPKEPTTIVGTETKNTPNSITVSLSGTFCTGSSIKIPYISSGTFYPSNTFTAQLSDSSGSFAAPVTIGSLSSTVSGTISCTVPSNIYGSHFAVRVVSDQPSVTGTATASAINVATLPVAKTTGNKTICQGESVAIGDSAVSGSTYSWTSSPAGFTSTSANPSVSPSVTTTYTVVETNVNGCSAQNSVTITVNPLPSAKAGRNQSICAGGSAVIGDSAVSGSTYKWTSSPAGFTSTSASVTVSPSVTTTYIVVETNANGCSAQNSVTITVNPLPSAKAGRNQSICAGGSAVIGDSAVSGSTYKWTSSPAGFTSTSASVTVSPSVTTTYTVVETNANGCSAQNSVTITVNPLPSAKAGKSQSICAGGSAVIGDSAVSGSTYKWTSIPAGFTSTSANPIVSPSVTTTYMVTETNAGGCVNSNYVTVTVNSAPAAYAGKDQSICAGGSVTIGDAAVNGSTYSWTSSPAGFTSNSASAIVSPSVTTTYTLKETNASGCSATNSVTVTVNPLPSATTAQDQTICAGTTIAIGGTKVAGSTYKWTSSPAGFTSTSANPVVTPSATTVYTLTETNANGCSNTHSVKITVNTAPVADAGSNVTYYYGYDNCPVLKGSANVSGASYLWSTGATTQSITVCPTVTTTYYLTVSSNGCTSVKDSVKVTVVDVHCHDDEDYKGKTKDTTKKILVCHKGVQICVSKNAVAAYLKNGDHLGSCDGDGDDRDNGRSDKDGCGKTATDAVTTGIDNNLKVAQSFNVYPNPFSSTATIDLSFAKTQNIAIDVISIDGRVMQTMYSGNVEANTPYKLVLDAENMNSGIYMVRVMSGDHVDYRRISLTK